MENADRIINTRTGEEYVVRTVSSIEVYFDPDPRPAPPEGFCCVYWGTHGCDLPRGHEGPHLCDCTYDENRNLIAHMDDDPETGNVGRPPYYGPDTHFYGEDT